MGRKIPVTLKEARILWAGLTKEYWEETIKYVRSECDKYTAIPAEAFFPLKSMGCDLDSRKLFSKSSFKIKGLAYFSAGIADKYIF